MGKSDGKDPDGRFNQRAALATAITTLDTTVAAARTNYLAGKGDYWSVRDLVNAQIDLARQRDLLPST
jgi:hypothetical protein